MNAEVPPAELGKAVEEFDLTYLVTVGENSLPHVVAVEPVFHTQPPQTLRIAAPGRHTRRNLAVHPVVTLIFAARRPGDYSLIVDGRGELVDDQLAITPTRAILHRPAAPGHTPAAGECANDCREIGL